MDNYIIKDIEEVTKRMKSEIAEIEAATGRKIEFSEYASMAIDYIYKKTISTDGRISLEDQHLIGAILGSLLHQAYCDSRKLDKPNEQGLKNNPRIKKLTDEMDSEFVRGVVNGETKQSPTLFINENGVVCMDIANTEFVNLSPFWKKDNYMAGKTAARTIITTWDGLTHENPEVRKYIEIAVANSIHESWISRGNVYYDTDGSQIYTNQELDNAYIYLPDDEKNKDLEHMVMSMKLISGLLEGLKKGKETSKDDKTTVTPNESHPGEE